MFRFILLSVLLICSATTQTLARQKWHELKSEHFILRTDAKLEKAKQTILDLEKFRATLGTITGLDLSVDDRPPLLIYAYRKTRTFRKELREDNFTLGFYRGRPNGAVAVLSLEDGKKMWQIKGLDIIFHEYSHHVLHSYSPFRYPRWYDEGFGEYLSTMEFKDNIAIVGKPVIPRFFHLRNAKHWARIEDIVRSRSAYPKTGRSRRGHKVNVREGLYAQGWLLTHYLISKDEYAEPLGKYMNALNSPNTNDDQAFEAAFGKSFIDMENELLDYWKSGSMPYLSYNMEGKMPDFDITVRAMSKAEANIQDHEVRHLTSRHRKNLSPIIKTFKKALRKGVRPDDMRIYLAELAMRESNIKAASQYIEAILEDSATHAPALHLKSRMFLSDKAWADLSHEQRQEYRKLVTEALKSDTKYVPAILDYARLYLTKRTKVTTHALDVIETARILAPNNYEAKTIHIALLQRSGNLAKARREAQLIIDWSWSQKSREYYEGIYKDLLNTASSEVSPPTESD